MYLWGYFSDPIVKILGDIQAIKTCIYDILMPGIGKFTIYTGQIRPVISRMCKEVTKVNNKKFCFGFNGVPYPGYIVT